MRLRVHGPPSVLQGPYTDTCRDVLVKRPGGEGVWEQDVLEYPALTRHWTAKKDRGKGTEGGGGMFPYRTTCLGVTRRGPDSARVRGCFPTTTGEPGLPPGGPVSSRYLHYRWVGSEGLVLISTFQQYPGHSSENKPKFYCD